MIEIEITPYMRYQAQKKAKQQGVLKYSFEKGEGNFAGYLGEELVKKYLEVGSSNTFNHDILYDTMRIDVKTKRCTSEPRPEYECSIPAYNVKKQNPDVYVFTRVLIKKDQPLRGWILGWLSKKEYMLQAKYIEKGTVDLSNGLVFPISCYNLEIKKLYSIGKLKEET